jgi:serine O-acetyltransferase
VSQSPPPLAWSLDTVVAELRGARNDWRARQQRPTASHGGRELPSRDTLRCVLQQLSGALFPMRLGPAELRQDTEDYYVGHTLDSALSALLQQARLELRHAQRHAGATAARDEAAEADAAVEAAARQAVQAFAQALPGIRRLLDTDAMAAFSGDPAARSVDEVLLCYPGLTALIHHRIAHTLYRQGLPLLARIVAEVAHSGTGIDIHPGAQIGAGFFIDHGTGVVIGETAVIGERVRLYQNVTLGAKSFPTDEDGSLKKGLPRHPIVEDDVVIYAGATVLGRVTIGRGSVIGGNVWLTNSVPPNSQVTQASLQSSC